MFYAIRSPRGHLMVEEMKQPRTQKLLEVPGTQVKTCRTPSEAKAFLAEGTPLKTPIVIYMDGSFCHQSEAGGAAILVECEGVLIHQESQSFQSDNPEITNSTSCEHKAMQMALRYCLEENISHVTLCFDYDGMHALWQPYLPNHPNSLYHKNFSLMRHLMTTCGSVVTPQKVKAHADNTWNNQVDAKAFEAMEEVRHGKVEKKPSMRGAQYLRKEILQKMHTFSYETFYRFDSFQDLYEKPELLTPEKAVEDFFLFCMAKVSKINLSLEELFTKHYSHLHFRAPTYVQEDLLAGWSLGKIYQYHPQTTIQELFSGVMVLAKKGGLSNLDDFLQTNFQSMDTSFEKTGSRLVHFHLQSYYEDLEREDLTDCASTARLEVSLLDTLSNPETRQLHSQMRRKETFSSLLKKTQKRPVMLITHLIYMRMRGYPVSIDNIMDKNDYFPPVKGEDALRNHYIKGGTLEQAMYRFYDDYKSVKTILLLTNRIVQFEPSLSMDKIVRPFLLFKRFKKGRHSPSYAHNEVRKYTENPFYSKVQTEVQKKTPFLRIPHKTGASIRTIGSYLVCEAILKNDATLLEAIPKQPELFRKKIDSTLMGTLQKGRPLMEILVDALQEEPKVSLVFRTVVQYWVNHPDVTAEELLFGKVPIGI